MSDTYDTYLEGPRTLEAPISIEIDVLIIPVSLIDESPYIEMIVLVAVHGK
jgi:hypothetical protein